MHIARVHIENYRTFHNADFDFGPGLNIIAGVNNAGKSAALAVIFELLDSSGREIFDHRLDRFNPTRVLHYCNDEAMKNPGSICVAIQLKPDSGPIRSSGQQHRLVFEVKEKFEVEVPVCETADATIELTLRDVFGQLTSLWLVRRADVNGGLYKARSCLFFELADGRQLHLHDSELELEREIVTKAIAVCHIPAMRPPSFLKSMLAQMVRQQYRDIASLKDNARERQIQWARACNLVSRRLSNLLAGVEYMLVVQDFNYEDSEKEVTEENLYVACTDKLRTLVTDRGSGTQTLGIMDMLLKQKAEGAIVLADELENSLHPPALRKVVSELSEAKFGSRQVILATHSPLLIQMCAPDNVTVLRKTGCNTIPLRVQMSSSKRTAAQTKQALRHIYPEMLFANHVLLVEGGEEYLIPALADALFTKPGWCDRNGLTITRVGGKGRFALWSEVLDSLRIPHTLLVDMDFIEKGIDKFLDRFDQKFKDDRSKLLAAVKSARAPQKESLSNDPASYDWLALESAMTEFEVDPSDPAKITQLSGAFNRYKDRIRKNPKIQEITSKDAALEAAVNKLINQCRQKEIFVLRFGELEDYIKSSGSKDISALLCAEQISTRADVRRMVQHWTDFEQLLNHLKSKL